MRNPRLASGLLCIAALALCRCVGERAPLTLEQGRALLDRCAAQHGGWTTLSEPGPVFRRSRVQLFAAEELVQSGESRTWTEWPARYRLELELDQGDTIVQIYDNGAAREWRNGEDSGRSVAAEVERRLIYQDILSRFRRATDFSIHSFGDALDRIWILEMALAADRWQIWIEDRSGELRRVVWRGQEGDAVVERADLLFDLAELDGGRRVPTRQVSMVDGEKVAEIQLLEFKRLPAADPNLFRAFSSVP